MSQCYQSGDFMDYFHENMSALGVPAPKSLFTTYTTVIAETSLITGAIGSFGAQATIAELVGATLLKEKLLVLGALGAAGYAGAAIGSLAVATGRSLGCGTRISDAFVLIHRHNLQFPGWDTFYHRHPQIIDASRPLRRNFGLMLHMQSRAA